MKISSAIAFVAATAGTTSAAALERRQDPLTNMPIGSEMSCYDGGQEWVDKDDAKWHTDNWCSERFPRTITTDHQIKTCIINDKQHYMLRMAAHGAAYTPFYMTVDECKTYMRMVIDSCIRGGEVRGPLENAWFPRYISVFARENFSDLTLTCTYRVDPGDGCDDDGGHDTIWF